MRRPFIARILLRTILNALIQCNSLQKQYETIYFNGPIGSLRDYYPNATVASMKKSWKSLPAVLLTAVLLFSTPFAQAVTLSFVEIVDDGGPNLSGQLSLDVTSFMSDVLFTFRNDVGFDSSITSVFFDIGSSDVTGISFSAANSSLTGVLFKEITNPTLPEGNTLTTVFDADFGETKDGPNTNGVDATGEFAGFLGTFGMGFSFDDLIADILSGTFRFGLHVTSIELESDGEGFDGSDSYINVVPIPAAAWLFGSAIFGFFVASKRRKERLM